MTIGEVNLINKTQEMMVAGVKIDMKKRRRSVIKTIEEKTEKGLVQEKIMAAEDMIEAEADPHIKRTLETKTIIMMINIIEIMTEIMTEETKMIETDIGEVTHPQMITETMKKEIVNIIGMKKGTMIGEIEITIIHKENQKERSQVVKEETSQNRRLEITKKVLFLKIKVVGISVKVPKKSPNQVLKMVRTLTQEGN